MNSEQRNQLLLVLSALQHDFYHPLEEICFCGFRAEQTLTLEEATRHSKHPMPMGTTVARPWEYAWLFADFVLPEAACGERIVLNLNPGGESTLFVNGHAFGTHRAEWVAVEHHYLVDQTIAMCAQGGESVQLAMEVYGGTPLPMAPLGRCATGPVFPEEGVRMQLPPLAVVGENSFGIWNEEAYQLWLDMQMLVDIHDTQSEDSFLREQISNVFGELLNWLDMEQALSERRMAYVEARRRLRPLMQAENGTFAPAMAVMGNSHLDVAWLWPIAETERKTIRTFAQQLRLLREYPEARYLQSQCVLYEMCRMRDPELFEEIKAAIRSNQWIADGAMWVEPDTNLAGGESLIRQFLYGMRYFKEELGAESHIAWLPDSFGYSAVLPQIVKGFGLEGLTTQKIFWTYNDAEKFPYHAFSWKGMDGSEIPCYLHMQYESFVDAKTLNRRWHERLSKDGSGMFYLPFGYGDGGGGPTRDDLEQIRRQKNLQGTPKLHYESPSSFIAQRKQMGLPVYCGELYFQCHRGTYTSQAAIKAWNRKSEQLLRVLELWCAAASIEVHTTYPSREIEALWKEALLNQFHDILPGSCIGQVYVEANARFRHLLQQADDLTKEALNSMKAGDCGVTLYHAQSTERMQVVPLDGRFAHGAVTYEGQQIPCVPYGEGALALVMLPALGRVSLKPAENALDVPRSFAEPTGKGWRLSNCFMDAVLNERGELVSVVDRRTGRQRIGGASNCLHMYRDVPRAYDAWDIDSQVFLRECMSEMEATSELIVPDGLRAAVRFTLKWLHSTFLLTVSVDANANRIDFAVEADWHERHKLLKVSFDTGIDAPEAANQIQFGYIKRPTHRSRTFDADRFEVCNHAFTAQYDATHGCAVLNDCKYGISMEGSVLSLSLLRGATSPDEAADQGQHAFCYAVYFWDGAFEESDVVSEAGALNVPIFTADGFAPRQSLLTCEDDRVVIDTVKLAEDGSGDVIVRLYESMDGQRTTRIGLPKGTTEIWRCSLDEEKQEKLANENGTVQLSFHPFEIITLRFTVQNRQMKLREE